MDVKTVVLKISSNLTVFDQLLTGDIALTDKIISINKKHFFSQRVVMLKNIKIYTQYKFDNPDNDVTDDFIKHMYDSPALQKYRLY